ncbi:MAG: helix-turn-helix transcriptional regulator [Erysipelotrichaceae bacterium]|nr:helix-turn-helix transcriptional regulator [Erysipelotrichaceae bacterium]
MKRKDLGLTQSDFADRLSVTRQTVSRWEAGTVLPDIDKINDIARILGVSCDYLLNDDIKEDNVTSSPISRVLQKAKGKTVRLTFFEEEGDFDFFNKDCRITDFEGNWMKAEVMTGKGQIEKLIPVSSVLSIEIVKGDE